MTDAPRVSVIMPARNAECYIAAAIASLWRGGVEDIEVLVVDDGSTDATARIVDDIAAREPRLRRMSLPPSGVSRARNAGIAAARAPCLTFLDADDLCAPDRIGRQLDCLERQGVRVVLGDLMLFEALDGDWRPRPGTRFNRVTGVSLTTMLFRREIFDDYGGCDEGLALGEDLDFLLRLMDGGEPIHHDPAIAVYYRRHDRNTTRLNPDGSKVMLRLLHRSLGRRRAGGQVGGRADLGKTFLMARQRADAGFGEGS
ncbi:MAG: glycosyltransferase family A protein [Azospirillaceae bacterium]